MAIFRIKNSDIFYISAQNIDCGYSLEPPHWGGSNEYPQSMFLSRNNKNNVYPYKPQFYYIKVGFKGVKIIQACFRDGSDFWGLGTFSYQAPTPSSPLAPARPNKFSKTVSNLRPSSIKGIWGSILPHKNFREHYII